jgi:hypothetical protein
MKTDELKNLVEAATPGPWSLSAETCYSGRMSGTYHRVWDDDLNAICAEEYGAHNDGGSANMRLIAAAPALAREVIALREAARDAAHALAWASGSDDFQEGGKAEAGWRRVAGPALATLRAVLGENE